MQTQWGDPDLGVRCLWIQSGMRASPYAAPSSVSVRPKFGQKSDFQMFTVSYSKNPGLKLFSFSRLLFYWLVGNQLTGEDKPP